METTIHEYVVLTYFGLKYPKYRVSKDGLFICFKKGLKEKSPTGITTGGIISKPEIQLRASGTESTRIVQFTRVSIHTFIL